MKERILEISKQENLSHIGSNLGVAEVLEHIHPQLKEDDIIILDEGHAGLAMYVYLEQHKGQDAVELFHKHGVHPNRDVEAGLEESAGSLGLAGAIALGRAMANPNRDVYCITSDGALAEGIWWETLRYKADHNIDNLKVHVNANGWSALDKVDIDKLESRLHAFCPDVVVHRTNTDVNENIKGLDSHYKTLK